MTYNPVDKQEGISSSFKEGGWYLLKELVKRALRHPSFGFGILLGAVGIVVAFATPVPSPGPIPLVELIKVRAQESDLFQKPMYLVTLDSTDRERPVAIRKLILRGSYELTGTYENLWNGNTGVVHGFRRNGVIQFVYIEDQKEKAAERFGIGATKLELLPPEKSTDPGAWAGFESGCDCSGNNTTAVPAVLYETPEPPSWLIKVMTKLPTVKEPWLGKTELMKRRENSHTGQSNS